MSGLPPFGMRVHAMDARWRGCLDGIDMHIYAVEPGKAVWCAKPMEFERREMPGATFPDAPTLRLAQEEAQKFMDALWDAGLRPAAGHGSAGQREALERHLNDMRAIVARQLDVKF